MPIYEFNCPACGKSFEKLCRSSQQQSSCPACGKQAQRILSVPAAVPGASESACGGGNSGFT